jgi:glycosyltransferase involved in cell wall biosynthesis
MTENTLASVIVNNFNYAAFLREAIDSALNQTWPNTEVIVVDDGSTDRSREIIAGYGDRITPLFQPNCGQTSALNAGFAASRGSAVFFLDADDTLFPAAVEQAVALLGDDDVAKVHWPLVEVNADSQPTGKLMCRNLPEGDLKEATLRLGPLSLNFSPTSGNAWSRRFLAEVFPLPVFPRAAVRNAGEKPPHLAGASVDSYLSTLAPLFGGVRRIQEPQSSYRVHGKNDYASQSFEARTRYELLSFDHCSAALQRYCRKLSIEVDPDFWKRNSWHHRVHEAVEDISAAIPDGESFILVDGGHWGAVEHIAGRRRIPFPERDGRSWGKPRDDAAAIQELERSRALGAGFMAFVWPAFWWLEHYSGMHDYLLTRFRRLRKTGSLILFDLGTGERTSTLPDPASVSGTAVF